MSVSDIFDLLDSEQENSDCYNKRLMKLASVGRDPSLIREGVADVLRTIDKGSRSFVVYGEPQSGKTEFMIALVCKLLDLGRKTIFIVMNDNTELENQNFDRFHLAQELNPTPMRDSQVNDLLAHNPEDLKTPKQRVIFCRKNVSRLNKLKDSCRFMTDRIVIDDEADFATPNAKINKDEVTAINRGVDALGKLSEEDGGTYIGVTATPARLDLNNTFLNNSRDWVFLKSHQVYKGRNFFFPVTNEEIESSNFKLVKLPDDTDDPRLLRHAVFRFLVRVAILNTIKGAETTGYSMLVHTAGKTDDHIKDHSDVTKIIHVLSDRNHNQWVQYVTELQKIANDLVVMHRVDMTPKELVVFVVRNALKSEVLTINHKNDANNVKRAGDPRSLFTFAIGGNIVSRGLTFERLLTFYFSRTVRGRLQQNTYIQRARMFGHRPYSEYFELCVPETLFTDWATVFQDHELSLRLAKAGAYQHIQSSGTAVVDAGAVDKRNVTMEKSERPIGSIFELTPELEQLLLGHNQEKPLSFLESALQQRLLPKEALPVALLTYFREAVKPDESDFLIVLKTDKKTGARSLQNIERYDDGDASTISRPRGGIVHAMLNKRREYDENRHFLLPIRNNLGQIRFLYKAKLGPSIFQNLLVQKPKH